MLVSTHTNIITKKVYNDNTEQLESLDFKQVKTIKRIKGGFNMMYKSYDDALREVVKSGLDLDIAIRIRDMFTYSKREIFLSPTDISSNLNIAKSKVQTVINRMIETNMLMKVSRGVYRLNPFMFIPFRSDGEELQEEWKNILNRQSGKI